jgi:lipooligosaccharide transport system permease protein
VAVNGERAAGAAISLRGVVKRFGPVTAVDGLDLEVPAGICLGLLGPNGAGKSTTMRMLTAQAIADEGEIEVLDWRLPAESKQARAEMGVVPQLDNLDVELSCRQILTVFARLYRVPKGEREAAVQRALEIANLVDRADTRVDLLAGGMRRRLLIARGLVHRPRLVLLDEPTVGLDPQIRQELWSLIDGLRAEGTTVLMSTHYIEEAAAAAARARARRARGARGLRAARAARAAARAGRRGRLGHAPRRDRARDPARGAPRRERRPAGRRTARRVARGRVRRADRRGGRVAMAATTPRSRGRRRLHWIEPTAVLGVMSRDATVFTRYWRTTTISSVVEPIIYLLAFGLGFGALVTQVGGLDYEQYIGTGIVAMAVLFSSAFPGMYGTFIKHRFQGTYDAFLAAPVDVAEIVTAEVAWIGVRAGVYGNAPLLVAIAFGLTPQWTALLVPLICLVTGCGFAAFGVLVSAIARSIDNFNYVQTLVLTPLFLLGGTFFPIDELPGAVQVLAQVNPLYHCVELVRGAVLGLEWIDLLHLAVLLAFALLMWLLAVRRMRARLII